MRFPVGQDLEVRAHTRQTDRQTHVTERITIYHAAFANDNNTRHKECDNVCKNWKNLKNWKGEKLTMSGKCSSYLRLLRILH